MAGYEYWSTFIPKPPSFQEGTSLELWGPNKRMFVTDVGNHTLNVSGTIQNFEFDVAKAMVPGKKKKKF